MELFSAPVIATLVGLVGSIVIGVSVDRIRLGIRMTVLEALFSEKSKSVVELDAKTNTQANRLTAIEAVIPELRRLVDALKDVPTLLARLETLLEGNQERIRDVEGHVFPFNRRPEDK